MMKEKRPCEYLAELNRKNEMQKGETNDSKRIDKRAGKVQSR